MGRLGWVEETGLLGIAAELGLNVVVEGVEKDNQLEAVPLNANISVQGWYFSKSLSRKEFVRYYQESKIKIRF
mgnify:CR=1 FL=1